MFNHTFEPANFDRYCDVLQAGVWVVYDNTLYNTTPFVTSDNPVLVEGVGKAATGLFSNGLANPHNLHLLPDKSKHCSKLAASFLAFAHLVSIWILLK